MADYIIYNNELLIMRVSCSELDVQTMATANSAFYTVDTFENYNLDQLKVVDGVLSVKSQDLQDAEDTIIKWSSVRSKRDKTLSDCDWTQAADSPLSDAKKAEWATYRQQLRDLPANTSDPANPTWPTPPS